MKCLKWLNLLIPFMLTACVTDLQPQYQGADTGYLVIGMGQMPDTSFTDYVYKYRSQNQSSDGGFVEYSTPNSFVNRAPDFTNINGSGIVEVVKIRPGSYELYNIVMIDDYGTMETTYQSKKEFSIPFTIKSSQAVYVGHFMAKEVKGRNIFGIAVPAGARFLISEQAPADLTIARTPRDRLVQLPQSASVTDSTPLTRQLNNPFFLPDMAVPEQ